LKHLDWELIEPKVINLISQTSDQYILVKMIDALTTSSFPVSVELIIVLMGRMVFESDQAALFKLSGILSSRADIDIIDGLMCMYDYAEKAKKPVILRLIGVLSFKKESSQEIGLREFLHRIVDEDSMGNKIQAATLLYRMGEENIAHLLSPLLDRALIEDKTEMIRSLCGTIRPDILPYIKDLLYEPNDLLHEALRESLLSINDTETIRQLLQLLEISTKLLRTETRDTEILESSDVSSSREKSDRTNKTLQMAVLYVGIFHHDKKVKIVSQPEIREIVKEYESILLSIFTKQGGILNKRMEGGYLFHFRSPLIAVLASLRLQEAMVRFRGNHLFFRIGIHQEKIYVEGEGDYLSAEMIATLFGNTSRDGSMLFSESVHKVVCRSIESRSVGAIRLRGLENPIHVYEPSGTVQEEGLTKESQADGDSTHESAVPDPGPSDAPEISRENNLLQKLNTTYERLHGMTFEVERGEKPISLMRDEIEKGWKALKEIMSITSATS
jgi:class 3 adenylate cyclase